MSLFASVNKRNLEWFWFPALNHYAEDGQELALTFAVRRETVVLYIFVTLLFFESEKGVQRIKLKNGYRKLVSLLLTGNFVAELMSKLVTDSGYEVVSNDYVMRETTNKKDGVTVPRVFLQGKYKKKG